jgi:hypothetical protein
VHLGREHQALDSMGLLGFLFGGLELAQGCLEYNDVLTGGN